MTEILFARLTDVVSGGVDNFLDLTDTPDSYAGHGGKAVAVKADASGLEFLTFPAGYTDEEAQDAVGNILTDSTTIDFTYNDATPSITAALIPGGITSLANLVTVQGFTVTLSDPGTDAFFGWDDSAAAWEALTAGEAAAIISGTNTFQPLDGDLTAIAALTTTAAGRSILTIADPNADRVIAWDDSAGSMAAIALADITTEAAPAAGDFVLIYTDAGAFAKVDWASLPGAGGGIGGSTGDTDNALLRADGAGGATLQSTEIIVDDSQNMTGVAALGTTTIELGHASDTTLSRSAAGVVQIEGVTVATASNTLTLSNKTLDLPQINDTSDDHQYVFAVNELAADRTVTLPLLTGNDTFVFEAHAATLTNKTINLANNTLTGTAAQFNTALSDDNFATLAAANVFTALNTFSLGTGATNEPLRVLNTTDNASVQVAQLEGDRATMADNDEAYVSLLLSDDGGTQTEFARLTWVATDVNAGTSVDGRIDFAVVTAGSLADELQLDGAALAPSTNDGLTLGTTTLGFADLHLATGGTINWANGEVTITETDANTLTVAGAAAVSLGTAAAFTTGTIELGAASDTTLSRSAAGTVQIEGVTVATATNTLTLSNKTLDLPQINDTSDDHQYVFAVSELAADRTVTLPLLTGDDTFVFAAFAQTLTNKTIDLTSNTLVGSVAEFNAALESADFYTTGGTDVALADGGTGTSLTDPNIDRLMGWDDSAGVVKFMALADINTEAAPASGDFIIIYDAAGNLLKTDWANLPGAGGGISNVVEDTTPELGGDLETNNFDIIMEQFSADGNEAILRFHKSRNASIGSHTVVQADDNLGAIEFYGSDGTNFELGARILVEVDGVPGADDMPARMSFWTTPDAGNTPSEHMRIHSSGAIAMGNTLLVTNWSGTTIGASATLESWFNDGNTNTVGYPLRLTRTGSTAAAGIGVGIEFAPESGTENVEVQGRLNCILSDVTDASEDSFFRFDIMSAGALETASFVPRVKRLTADHSISSTTATEVTGLEFVAVHPGTYVVQYFLIVQSSVATTGLAFSINFTGTLSRQVVVVRWPDTSATASTGVPDDALTGAGGAMGTHATRTLATSTPNMTGVGITTINQDHMMVIEAIIVVTAVGNLELWHGSETANATVVELGSSAILTRTE